MQSQLRMPLHNNYRSPRIDPSTQGLYVLHICLSFLLLAQESRDLSQDEPKKMLLQAEQINFFLLKMVRFEKKHHFE